MPVVRLRTARIWNVVAARLSVSLTAWVDSIVQGMPADVIAPKARALEAEKASIAEQLAAADDKKNVVSIHPAAIKNYLKDVAAIREALDDEDAAERPELIAPLRRLIHSVIVHAQPGVKGFEVEIKGRLKELLGLPFARRSPGGGLVVAGEGLAPDPRIMIPDVRPSVDKYFSPTH